MRAHPGLRSEQALLFGGPQSHANRALRLQARRFQDAQRFHHGRDTVGVVGGAGAGVVGIEVRAEQDNLIATCGIGSRQLSEHGVLGAIVGQDPNFPTAWPRDGRMRRKNMRGVDEVLTTFGDHLGGIDLNRNHPPFWATSTGSSTNPNSLTYHGIGPHSESENLALERAAELAPVSRIRLGIDVHTFSRAS